MTDDQYNQAKRLVAELGSMLKASIAMGIPYPTFRRQYLKRDSEPQPAAQSEPESDLLSPGISEALAKGHELARRKIEEDRRREYDEFLSQFRRQQSRK